MRFHYIPLLFTLAASATSASDDILTLTFDINPVITGARPWDGTGLNSAQLDGDSGGIFSLGKQVLLDQSNQRMAPPDPYICYLFDPTQGLQCYPQQRAQDTVTFKATISTSQITHGWFGVALLDSDQGNIAGGIDGDDLIGFGVVLDEQTLTLVLEQDADARQQAKEAEQIMTDAVSRQFGTNRSLFGAAGGGKLESAKLARSKCEYGCSFGDAQITLSTSVDGW